MSDNMIETLSTQIKQSLEPMNKIGSLVQANFEKLAELQMQSFKTYSELATRQLKAMANVRDLDGLKALGTTQTEIAGEISQKIMADLKEIADMGMALKTEIESALINKDAPANKEAPAAKKEAASGKKESEAK